MSTLKIKGTSSGEVVLSANADGSQLSVDQKIIGANVNNRPNPAPLIINGDMRVAQYSFDTSFTKTGVNDHSGGAVTCIDRMYTGITDNGTFTISRDTDVPTGYGFVNSMKLDCTTADTSVAAGSFHTLEYRFEGQDTQLFKKGTSNSYAMTVAFWIKSTVTGTAIVELADDDNTRHIAKTFTVASANTWEKKVLSFAADTTGTLNNDNGRSFRINIFLGAGSNLTSGTLATSWASRTTANIAAGQTINAASSTDNNILITGLQMELGEYSSTTIPEFQFEERGASLRRCQRYYQHHVGSDSNCAGTAAGGFRTNATAQMTFHFPVEMRADPTVSQVATDNMLCHDLADGNNINVDSVESTIHSSTGGITVQFTLEGTSGNAGDSCHLIPTGSTPGVTFSAEVG